ncbi:MAG TPA: acetyl-CoA carboxylase biotin carboxyl carrier protein subunit, partial [Caldimonas sp.]
VDDRQVRATGAVVGAAGWWRAEGADLEAIDLRLRGAARATAAAAGLLRAPLHGRVTEACVAPGATVAAGALLLVIEAMKMEHQIRAPHAGTIAAVLVRAGDQVSARQPLVEVTP